jgi:site-specific DNA recombinase
MRALCYFMVDPIAATEATGSLSTQDYTFRQYCELNHHTPVQIFTDQLHDESLPGYRAMIDSIRQSGLWYLLILTDIRHLGRDLEQSVSHLLELDELNIKVICVDSEIPDPLLGVVSYWMSSSPTASRRKRIREAMLEKAIRGEGLGKPPYGYRIGTNSKLEIVSGEAVVVRLIFKLYLDQALGVRSIAKYVNDAGYITRRSQAWSMVTIRDILRNHAYIGTYSRFGMRISGSHESIVPATDFKQVQDRMRGRSPRRRNFQTRPFLLSSLLFCGECGNGMMGVTRRQVWQRKSGERIQGEYRYYQCQSRTNRSQCQYHTWREAEIEGLVLEQVRKKTLLEPVTFQPNTEPVARLEDAPSETKADKRLATLRRRHEVYVRRAASGSLSLGHLRVLLANLDNKRKEIMRRLEKSEDDTPNSLEQRNRFLEDWGNLALEERRDVLRSLVRKITVHGKDVEIVLNPIAASEYPHVPKLNEID